MIGSTAHLPLFNQRVKNIVDELNFKEPEKVPVGFDYLNWPYVCSEKTLKEVVNDPVENANCYCRFMDRIKFDFTMNSGFYEPFDALAALGSNGYPLHSDGCTVQQNQAGHLFIDDEDMNVLINDFHYFANEYYPKKAVPAFRLPKEEAYEMLKKSAACAVNNIKTSEYIAKKVIFDHQIVPLAMAGPPDTAVHSKVDAGETTEKQVVNYDSFSPFYYAPIDSLFDNYRGMMGIFDDLIENTENLDKACQSIQEDLLQHLPANLSFDGHILPTGFTVFHCAPFLNPEQFDKYWFQGFKHSFLPFAEQGARIFLKGEGSFLHLIERFKELPRGSVIIQLDVDDPIEANKRIGGHQILCTGMRTSLLALNNRQLCVDHIKKSFDELAPGGGFLFYQDVPLLSPSDAEPAFVEEIWNFANEYSISK